MEQNQKLKGTFYVLLCVFLWGLIPVVAKIGQSSLDNHQFLFWSSLVSFLVLLGSSFIKDRWKSFATISLRGYAWLVFLGLLGTYIYYLFLYLGYARAAGMEVLVVQYTWPLLIVLLSIVILHESLNGKKLLSLVLGFAGVVCVLTKGKLGEIQFSGLGVILWVAAGAFCFALFSVLSKHVEYEPLTVISIYFLSALSASFLSMLHFSTFDIPQDFRTLIAILLNGVLVNGFSYVFWIAALKAVDASYIAPFTFMTPLVSAVYLILFFGEPFLVAYAVGLIFVVSAGLINTMGENRA